MKARFIGHGILWDIGRDAPLCTFDKEGELITEDTELIERLRAEGYSFEVIEDFQP